MIDTPGKLYDELHKRFGVGSYDESLTRVEWWKARNVEISKIKAMMRKRKTDLPDLVLTLEYAVANGRPVTESWHLFDLVYEAKKAARTAEERSATSVRDRLTAAAGAAMEAGDSTWAARLYNASEHAGAEVLEQYERSRS